MLLSFLMERKAYKDTGVDIEKLDRFRAIGIDVSRRTMISTVEEIRKGKFFLNLKKALEGFSDPLEKHETDGIGTKQDLAAIFDKNQVSGEDIVTCNVSDVLRHGAIPYTFDLSVSFTDIPDDVFASLMEGVYQGCKKSGVTLFGGETAQIPLEYKYGRYELMGTVSGYVEKDKVLCPEKVEAGDVILAVESSGLHTNGYSLARKIIEKNAWCGLKFPFIEGRKLSNVILTPEKNYTKAFLELFSCNLDLHQAEHITGSGLTGRLEGIGGDNLAVKVDRKSWEPLTIFKLLKRWGEIEDEEMFATFNMGVGMVIVLPKGEVIKAKEVLENYGHESFVIGKVAKRRQDKVLYIR